MAQNKIVIDQLLSLIPRKLFDSRVAQFEVNKGVRKLSADAHLAVMLFAQITGLSSLRDIEQATVGLTPVQRCSGLTETRRSTLAEANKRIPHTFYQTLFFDLLAPVKDRFPEHDFAQIGKLFSIDSTTISLCLSLYEWAQYKTRKGGMKLHTVLDHDGYIPSVIEMTEAKVHDIVEGRKFSFTPGDTLLFDRGYFDSAWFNELCEQGIFFVTRMKENIDFEYTDCRRTDRTANIRGDWTGHLTGSCGEKCRRPLRLVRVYDPEKDEKVEFLTNLLEVDAKTIADLYRERWQIELFFKWIKQNLKIKSYLGTDKNAVLIQVWIAMITYLLVRLVQSRAPENAITTHTLMRFIATRALVTVKLSQAWKGFQRTNATRVEIAKTRSRRLNI